MKKFLLSLTLLCAVFFGHSQRDLWFNEISPEPSKSRGNTEFIELYNTSTSSIPLDCYVIVSYYNTGSEKGVYVYNFPTGVTINPLSHYVISSGIPVKYQQSGSYSGSNVSNWNGNLTGGYIEKYVLSTSNQWPTSGAAVGVNFNDFMYITTGNDASVNLMLFRINADGTSTLVNSVFGNGNGSIPTAVTNLPILTVPSGSSSCAPTGTRIPLNFSGITFNNTETFNIGQSTGNDNAYARYGDATCGGWDKFTGPPNTPVTPGQPNPLGGTRVPSLTTTERIVCNSSIQIQITSQTSSTTYPVEARLYADNNKDGKLDVGDTYLESITITSGSTTVYPFSTVYDPAKSYIVVYRTALGCFDQIKVPTVATGSLTTTAKSICGKQVDFTITGASGSAGAYTLPVIVELHYDLDGDRILDENEAAVIDQKEITSFSNTVYNFINPDPTKQVILVYKTAQSCFNKSEFVVPATGTLSTTESYVCNNRLSFNLSGGTTSDATNYSLPVDVKVYNEATGELLGSKTVTAFSTLTDYIDLVPTDWNTTTIRVEYKSINDCFSKTVSSPAKVPTGAISLKALLPTSTTVSYSIDNITTASDAYPFTIIVYEDRNNNGRGDADEIILMQEQVNTAPPANTIFSTTLKDTKYNAVAEAKSTVGCSEATLVLAPAKPLPVKLTSFTAKRNRDRVELTWQTAMELNNRGFEVLRKVGNSEWKVIAFVFSQADGGNSKGVLNYEFADIQPDKGASQYRLRQIDIDSRATLSEVRLVHSEDQAGKLQLFPNPSSDGRVNLVFEDRNVTRTITVSDLTGRVVKQYRQITASSLQIDNLQNGIYTLHITNATTGETTVSKFIVKKQ